MTAGQRITRRVMYGHFAESVMDLIRREKLWSKYLVPERELARMFGVSRETARRGLAILEKRGVIAREQRSGTFVLPRSRPRRAARPGASRILVGSYQDPEKSGFFGGELMAGIAGAAAQMGQLLQFVNLAMPIGRQKAFEELASGKLDGLLLVSITDRQLVGEFRRAWRGPMIMADHHFDGIPVTGVVDDSHGGARLVTEHLLELGHRRIGYVEIARREMNPWRYGGYADALKDAGIRPEPGLVSPSFGSFESGRMAGDALLAARNPPTAVFAFDDVRAWGVWRAAEARGLRVGRDFALAGYGDTAASSGFPEALTSVHFNYRKVGQVSVEKLSEYIGGTAGNGEIITLPTKLVVRESSRNARLRPEGRKAKTGGPV